MFKGHHVHGTASHSSLDHCFSVRRVVMREQQKQWDEMSQASHYTLLGHTEVIIYPYQESSWFQFS